MSPPGRPKGANRSAQHEVAPGSRELFVYWRVDPASAGEATRAVAACQAALRERWPGLAARLYQRVEPTDGRDAAEQAGRSEEPQAQSAAVTLMETYAHPDGIDPALQAAIGAAIEAVAGAWRCGPRHTECFDEVKP